MYFHIALCSNFDDFLTWSQKSISLKMSTSYILSIKPQNKLQNVTQVLDGLFNIQSNITQSTLPLGDVIFIEAISGMPMIELSQKDFTIINDSSTHLDKAPLLISDAKLIYIWTKHAISLFQQYEEITILPVITDSNNNYVSSCNGHSIFIIDPRCSVKYVNKQVVNLYTQKRKCLRFSVYYLPCKSQIIPYVAQTPLFFYDIPVNGYYTRECTQKWVLCGTYLRMRPRIIIFVKIKTFKKQMFRIPPLSTYNKLCSCSRNFTECQPHNSDIVSDRLISGYAQYTSLAINERRACYAFKDCYYFKIISNMYREITDIFKLNFIQPMLPINITISNLLRKTLPKISNIKMQYSTSYIPTKINTVRHVIIGMSILLIVFLIFIVFMSSRSTRFI